MRFWKTRKTPGNPKVSLAAAAFLADARQTDALLCFVHSIAAQTYPHWELLVVHDGPNPAFDRLFASRVPDPRVRGVTTEVRKGDFGHPWRLWAARQLAGKYVGLPNADNYYAPVYLEALVHALATKRAKFAYCDMVHSHRQWAPLTTAPRRGKIDVGGWLADRDLVCAQTWPPAAQFHSDGVFVEQLVAKAGHAAVKVAGHFFVHN